MGRGDIFQQNIISSTQAHNVLLLNLFSLLRWTLSFSSAIDGFFLSQQHSRFHTLTQHLFSSFITHTTALIYI